MSANSIIRSRGVALVGTLCVAGALAAAPPASAVSASARARCVSKGYRVIYQTSQGGLFQTARGAHNYRQRGGYFACLYRYGVRQTIGSYAPAQFSFAGRYFAYTRPAVHEEGGDVFEAAVAVIDLGTSRPSRKWVHRAPSGHPGTQTGQTTQPVGYEPVIELVVTTNGAAAWLAQPAEQGGTDYQVLAVDGHGVDRPARLLDSGPAIDLRSLKRFQKTGVRWVNAGAEKTARLQGA